MMKEAHIALLRSELLYDIGRMMYVEGDLAEHDTGKEHHQVIDGIVGDNLNRVIRTLNLCWTKVIETLYPFVKSDIEPVELRDNTLTSEYSYCLTLRIPEGYAESSVNRLTALLHEYMVSYAVADWMSITKPGAEAKWQEKCAVLEQDLASTINRRMRRVRRSMTPW